jgi:hypothetical protein
MVVLPLLLLLLQVPSPCVLSLCEAAGPRMAVLQAQSICSLLQLASRAGQTLSPVWLDEALAALTPELNRLDGSTALQLLQSLGSLQELQGTTADSQLGSSLRFWAALQQRLAVVVRDLDAFGVAAVLAGQVQSGQVPSSKLQLAVAECLQDGSARAGAGLEAAAVWLLLKSLLDMQTVLFAAPAEMLLDAVLQQVAKHSDDIRYRRSSSSASSRGASRQRLLLQLASALAAGGPWGSYKPSFQLCSLLCSACLQETHSSLAPGVWLGLVVRFEGLGYTPSDAWLAAARQHLEKHPLLSMQEDGEQQQQQQQQQQHEEEEQTRGTIGRAA